MRDLQIEFFNCFILYVKLAKSNVNRYVDPTSLSSSSRGIDLVSAALHSYSKEDS